MKSKFIIPVIGTAMALILLASCNNVLEETPRATYTPEFFKTSDGVMCGLTAEYATLRRMWGDAYFYSSGLTGTDEATWGASGSTGNFKQMDCSGQGIITPSISDASGMWGNMFPAINTASGIIENAEAVGTIDVSLIAEARFFRAFYYFYLVQNFGGVPLDLGSGELAFNISPVRTSVRNTVPEVYTKAIFPDLLTAIANLPETGRLTGALTKTTARLTLAKAYLTYAWWLHNPNNISTYPTCDRTDPDGHDYNWYFQQAYNYAIEGINNPGSFGLCTTYYDVNVATNDRNKEIVLYADRTQSSEYWNDASLSYASGGGTDNFAAWMMTWSYTSLQSSKTSWASATTCNSVQREAEQHLGRPWTRMAPPQEVFFNTFADKTNDSRYDGTFVTTYHGNWNKAGITNAYLYGANDIQIQQGDAVLTFLDAASTDPVDYTNSVYKSGVAAGVISGRADFVIEPQYISRVAFPGCGYKIGTYRTDNGTGLGQPNGSITRPFPVEKFSELFFIAAEAIVEGNFTPTPVTGTYANDGTARGLINVIRGRAGVWRYNNNGNAIKIEDDSQTMKDATPVSVDLNYILAERSREYFAEGVRWYDLVRTQTWGTIAHSFTICGLTVGDHTPVTYTRTIDDHLYLRPIPQGQIDALDMTTEEKAAYQNPGY